MSALSLPNFIFDHRLLTSASFMLFYSVDSGPYVGCHMIQSRPIAIGPWVLFLFYNTGTGWHDAKLNFLKKCLYSSDADINDNSSLESL